MIFAGFILYRVVKRVYENRRVMIENGNGIDWVMGEVLVFVFLFDEGNYVCLFG